MTEVHKNKWELLEVAREQFIHQLSQNMHLYGISESVGRLYGTVLFSDKPMNLDEMSQSLEMSKTSMSTGIRSLLKANMVKRVWQKGSRRDLYLAGEDWYRSFTTTFVTRWRTSVDNNLEAVEELKQTLLDLKSTDQEELEQTIEQDLEKLVYAKKYYEWLLEVINLFESGEIFNIVPKKE